MKIKFWKKDLAPILLSEMDTDHGELRLTHRSGKVRPVGTQTNYRRTAYEKNASRRRSS
ncbi:hypothetical protein ABIE63_000739 [Limibacillus sp. MBR-115]|jgi:hypothetical protein